MKSIRKPINNSWVWQALSYAGLLPFIFFIGLSYFPLQSIEFKPHQAFVFYSAMILSFLSGALWSVHGTFFRDVKVTQKYVNNGTYLQIISNVFCLYAFGCLLMPINNGLLFLLFGYLGLLFAEYILCYATEKCYTKTYFTLRIILTFCVVILHVYAFYFWYLT